MIWLRRVTAEGQSENLPTLVKVFFGQEIREFCVDGARNQFVLCWLLETSAEKGGVNLFNNLLCWLLMISAEQIASFPHQLLVCSRLMCSLGEAWGSMFWSFQTELSDSDTNRSPLSRKISSNGLLGHNRTTRVTPYISRTSLRLSDLPL